MTRNVTRTWFCRRRLTSVILFALASSAVAGCSITPGTTLSAPPPQPAPLAATAWIEEIKIADPEVKQQQAVGEAFTLSVHDYIEHGGYFRAVKLMPGKPAPQDDILHFEFDRFRQSRHYHPLYFPCAFLTATLWIWFGGPIFVDDVDLQGTLTVTRPDGTQLARVSAVQKEHGWKNLYSKGYLTRDLTAERSALVADLLSQTMAQLRHGG